MTHHRGDLETTKVLATAASARLAHAAFEKLADKILPSPTDVVMRGIQHDLEAGTLVGACWKGDWKSKLAEWIPGAEALIGRKMLDVDAFRDYCSISDGAWEIVGSGELLESAYGQMDGAMLTIYGSFAGPGAKTELLDPSRMSKGVRIA